MSSMGTISPLRGTFGNRDIGSLLLGSVVDSAAISSLFHAIIEHGTQSDCGDRVRLQLASNGAGVGAGLLFEGMSVGRKFMVKLGLTA